MVKPVKQSVLCLPGLKAISRILVLKMYHGGHLLI